jgi:hypothetical protein
MFELQIQVKLLLPAALEPGDKNHRMQITQPPVSEQSGTQRIESSGKP